MYITVFSADFFPAKASGRTWRRSRLTPLAVNCKAVFIVWTLAPPLDRWKCCLPYNNLVIVSDIKTNENRHSWFLVTRMPVLFVGRQDLAPKARKNIEAVKCK